ncbi:MAG: peroxiredoxin family protein [Thermoplasmatota archaeon]
MLRPGELAPDFVLTDADGDDVRLSSLSGRPILLVFFAKAANPFALRLLRALRDQHDEILRRGAIVAAVSLDKAGHLAALQSRHNIPFTLLADADGHVHDLYEAWRTSLLGRTAWAARRCTYILDEDGVLIKHYRAVNPLGHHRQLVKDLDRLAAQQSWGKPEGDPRMRRLRRPSLKRSGGGKNGGAP